GERLTTHFEFAAVLRDGAASILQPALGRAGGILVTKKIAAMAECYQALVAPHLYAGPVEALANIHFGLSIPNFLMAEMIEAMGGFHAE
ncbi:MAG: enolase C-terminal domain-like protein, partial [Alphaproteobacteria bacterium]